MDKKDEKLIKVLEEVVKKPDELFPTFSEEIAEKIRQELKNAFTDSQNKDKVSETLF